MCGTTYLHQGNRIVFVVVRTVVGRADCSFVWLEGGDLGAVVGAGGLGILLEPSDIALPGRVALGKMGFWPL